MKYCRVIVFTSVRLDDPANDHDRLTSAPIVNSTGCTRATTEGPIDHLPDPSASSVAVGSNRAGPTPQIILEGLRAKKSVG